MTKLFKIISRNKKALFLVLGIGLFLSLFPLHNAQAADIWSDISDYLKKLPDFIAGGAVWVAAWPFMFGLTLTLLIGCALSIIIFFISLYLLKWVTSGWLITLPFTHGGIVDAGWQATLSIANLAFVLVLVFISLSTILRLENYGMKKLLPKFILVIILINFSGVICGMVVDIANAVTRSFLNFDPLAVFKGGLLNPFSEDISNVSRLFHGDLTGLFDEVTKLISLSGIVQTVTKYIMLIFFGLFSGFVFGLYFILFLLRYIAIWILVILAPIAWFCWILPDFKGIYQTWEKYFVQWAFIGVIAGFFLKLGAVAMTALAGKFGTLSAPDVGGGSPQFFADIFGFLFTSLNSIILSAAVLVFLIVGFIISLKSAGGGTETILQWGKKGLDNAGKVASSLAQRRITGPILGRVAKGMANVADRGERWADSSGQKFKWRGKERTTPWASAAKWATKGPAAVFAPAFIEYAAKQRKASMPSSWGQMSVPEKEDITETQGFDEDKLGFASKMKEEGTYQKASEGFRGKMRSVRDKFASDPRYKKEVGDLMDAEPDKINHKLKLDFELAGVPKGEIKDKRREVEEALGKIKLEFDLKDDADGKADDKAAQISQFRGLKPKDISEVAKGSLKSNLFRMALHKMNSSHLQNLKDSSNEETVRTVLEEGDGLNNIKEEVKLKELFDKNPKLVRWAFNVPAGRETLNWSENFPGFFKKEGEKGKLTWEEAAKRAGEEMRGQTPPPSPPPQQPPSTPPGQPASGGEFGRSQPIWKKTPKKKY